MRAPCYRALAVCSSPARIATCGSWMPVRHYAVRPHRSCRAPFSIGPWPGSELILAKGGPEGLRRPFRRVNRMDVSGRRWFCAPGAPVYRSLHRSSWTPTSLSFPAKSTNAGGNGGVPRTIGPDLNPMIPRRHRSCRLRPVLHEMMPGNTADVSMAACRSCGGPCAAVFRYHRGCIVADRGMISQATINGR